MDAKTATKSEQRGAELKGSNVIAAIKQSGVEFVLAVPDIHHQQRTAVSDRRRSGPASHQGLQGRRVRRHRVGIALYRPARADADPVHRLLNSLNAIRGVAVEYKQPICMMVGLLGHDAECPPSESSKYGVRIIEPICEAMGIPHHVIDQDSDLAKIKPAIDKAYADSFPVVMLIGRRPS